MPGLDAICRGAAPLLAAAMLTAMAACSGPVGLPPDPPGVVAADGAFGAGVREAEGPARKAVADQLASRFGRDLRVLPRSIDGDAEPGAVKAHYDKALIAGRGWTDFPLAVDNTAWSFAYTSPDGRSVLAVVVLNPRFAPENGGPVPFTILTNLPAQGG